MHPTRFRVLRGTIVQFLQASKPMLMPETQLLVDVRLCLLPMATMSEFEHVLNRMEEAKQIIRHRTEDEGIKVKLSEVGEAEFPG